MLATKRLAGDAPEVNLGQCVTRTPRPSMNKAAHSVAGYGNPEETSPEVQNKGISVPTKRTYVTQI